MCNGMMNHIKIKSEMKVEKWRKRDKKEESII